MNQKYFSLLSEIHEEHKNSEKMNMNSRVLVIDGTNTFIRSYVKSPAMNDDGIHIGGISGFLKSVGYCIKMVNATRCIIVFDGKGGSQRRKKLFPDYKKKRSTRLSFNRTYDFKSPDEELQDMARQIHRLGEYLSLCPFTILSVDNIEADDAIAHITTNVFNKPENKVFIMSGDKDFLQLVNDRVNVWSPTKKKLYTPSLVLEEYGFNPENFIYFRMLDGDVSDNISGIKGFGEKKIKQHFPFLAESRKVDVSEIYQACEANAKKYKILQTLLDSKEQMQLNYDLMQLECVDISGHAKMYINDKVEEKLKPFNKFEFQRLCIADKFTTDIFSAVDFMQTIRMIDSYVTNA
jgi:5'-3' exonuclease